MRGRLTLAVAWLALSALVAPGAPIAEEPATAPEPAPLEQPAPEPAPVEAPATEPESQSSPPEPVSPDAAAQPPAPPSEPAPTAAPAKPVARSSPAGPRPKTDRPIAFAATPGSVRIEDFSFGPASVTVGVGESVTWRNDGPSEHTATATDGSFDTGLLSPGESGRATFDEAGSFSYLCTPHPFMKGTVRVVAQASGDAPGAGGDTADGGAGSSEGGTAAGTAGSSNGGTATGLPATGAEPAWLAMTGLGLLLIGASGMRGAHRRARP
jgi:plastocyanin